MITSEDTTSPSTTKRTYTAAAPDTSNITLVVDGNMSTITYGGSSFGIPFNALPVLIALIATAGAWIEPIPAEVEPEPEATPAAEPTTTGS
jgi:hypothetical protein